MVKSIFILLFIILLIVLLGVAIFVQYKMMREHFKNENWGFVCFFTTWLLVSFLVLTALVVSLFS